MCIAIEILNYFWKTYVGHAGGCNVPHLENKIESNKTLLDTSQEVIKTWICTSLMYGIKP